MPTGYRKSDGSCYLFGEGNTTGPRFQLGNTFSVGRTNKSGLGKRGSETNHWKGGRAKAGNGKYVYIYSPDHPLRTKDGYVMEHRLVMEASLGRYLERTEYVHHKNGNTQDNRLENLELVTKKQHAHKHFGDCKRVAELEAELKLYKEKFGEL